MATTIKAPSPLTSFARLQLPFILFLLLPLGVTSAGQTWPCIQTSPTGGICDDKTPPTPCIRSPATNDFVCENPGCTSDAECLTFGCDLSGTKKCFDFMQKKEGETCLSHKECGLGLLCDNGKKCRKLPATSTFLASTFGLCTVGAAAGSSNGCDSFEECRPDPDASTGKGICLLKSTNPAEIKQLDDALKPGGAGGRVGKEGEPCTTGVDRCETPFFCDKDNVCKKTTGLKSEQTKHRIPPPPGDPNCRDALDSGETDEANSKCGDREQMCTEPLYVQMMKEQCPKTCGYCDDPTLDLTDYADQSADEAAGGGIDSDGTVKVDPSAACSDRKLPNKESDCPRLKDLCDDPIYKPLLQKQCRKTCKFCT